MNGVVAWIFMATHSSRLVLGQSSCVNCMWDRMISNRPPEWFVLSIPSCLTIYRWERSDQLIDV